MKWHSNCSLATFFLHESLESRNVCSGSRSFFLSTCHCSFSPINFGWLFYLDTFFIAYQYLRIVGNFKMQVFSIFDNEEPYHLKVSDTVFGLYYFWETPLLYLLSTTLRTWNSRYSSAHFLKGGCIPLYQFLQLLRGLGEWVKYHTLLSVVGNHFGGSHSTWLCDSSWLLAEFLSQLKIIALVNHHWLCD